MTFDQSPGEPVLVKERPAIERDAAVVPATGPAANERLAFIPLVDRVANIVVMVLPLALVGWAAWLTWGGALHWSDLVALAITYALTGLGITVGFHRLLTHRSFKTSPALRGLFAILGSAAVEGPVIEWVANHRKHHQFSDEPGDPHSPHVGHGSGWRAAVGGLFHAHVGWILGGDALASEERYAKDLLTDPVVRFVDRTFVLWVILGLAFPFGLGVALTGTVVGGLTAMLWGGAVRMFLLHHATFSINSLCHFFGRRTLCHERPVTQPAVARAPHDGRGVAQQPPCLSHLRTPRPALVAARPLRLADRRARAHRSGMGRRSHLPRAPTREDRRRCLERTASRRLAEARV